MNTSPQIDVSQVPAHLRSHPKFLKEMTDLLSRLSKPEYLDLFAKHEAGHEHYFREASVTRFEYIPPLISYREANEEEPFLGQWARIKTLDYKQPEDDGWLFKLAKGYAAGGECSRRLTTTDYAGDTIDRKLWDEMCADCYKDSTLAKPEVDAIADDLWVKAQKTVGKELESEELKSRIRKRAREITPLLYPWTLSLT